MVVRVFVTSLAMVASVTVQMPDGRSSFVTAYRFSVSPRRFSTSAATTTKASFRTTERTTGYFAAASFAVDSRRHAGKTSPEASVHDVFASSMRYE